MKGIYSNCFLAILYLIFRGKVKEVIAVSKEGGKRRFHCICHFLAVNQKGHILHFHHILNHKYNPLAPYWFYGRIIGISKSKQQDALKNSNRKILWRTNHIFIITVVFISILLPCILASIPLWGLYPLYFNIKGMISAIKKNRTIKL